MADFFQFPLALFPRALSALAHSQNLNPVCKFRPRGPGTRK